ncbi:50S ribosomal protein L18 [Natranaerobius thermophilus]|uniref:Large ribosomal subunit protein uL18 n=1 Tax=Natranaerobius thermophilus (strain ATCC BAA-1301 / DSM 18059 / JW/NM-WN-LF) TaxID=457570 RepID=B2A4F5_NATTJ|nr:50S ribosomal protein L18 [Natranaerobius thermophilus]ACB83809.1 LSU ribosomal protein L18P [Natranaerobius thermophilus JW/NM-WN-LF]
MPRFDRKQARKKRHRRVRKKIYGTSERPRLNVYRSAKNIHAQVIDDNRGHTLVHASTLDPEIKDDYQGKNNQEASAAVGRLIAKRSKDKGIEDVIFDRGGYLYHGRVKALAEAAREEGLNF